MKQITAPFTQSIVENLTAGDTVLITGTIYTARDAPHKRLCEAGAGHRRRGADHQRQNGCLCSHPNGARPAGHDR